MKPRNPTPRLAMLAAALLLPLPASAHPEHPGGSGLDLLHLLGDPFHLLVAIASAAGVAALLAWRRRTREREARF